MSLVLCSGSIAGTNADAIVNPVNCKGTMGAGLAKAMADAWPLAVGPYQDACVDGRLRPGGVHPVDLWAYPLWVPFFWDSNDRWGLAKTADDWAAIRRDLLGAGWTQEQILSAKSRPEIAGEPMGFGFRMEHRESPTLGEFFRRRTLVGPRWMICFASKDHWRDRSRIEWVESGLVALSGLALSLDLRSMAVPALGCGLGGLSWHVVRPMLESWAASAPFQVRLYPPKKRKRSP